MIYLLCLLYEYCSIHSFAILCVVYLIRIVFIRLMLLRIKSLPHNFEGNISCTTAAVFLMNMT